MSLDKDATDQVLQLVRSRLASAEQLTAERKPSSDARHKAAMLRHEVWSTLWRAAYVEHPGSPDLLSALDELFPPGPQLQHHLDHTLASLSGSDAKAATHAAKQLERLSHRSLTMPLEREVGDPRLVMAVCGLIGDRGLPGLEGPAALPAITSLVRYLRACGERLSFEGSTEVYDALARAWRFVPTSLRVEVAAAVCYLSQPQKWDLIVEALEQDAISGQPEWLASALNFAGEPPIELVPRLTASILGCVERSERPQDWVSAVGHCAGPEALGLLERLRTKEQSSATLEALRAAEDRIRLRFVS